MSSVIFEIVLILILVIANGVFSGSEIAIVSARKIRLEQLAERGDHRARKALKLAKSPNDFLSAVQIGITLIGILSGAVGGATLAQRLQPLLNQFSPLRPYSEGVSVAIVVSIITYLSLVIGELLPKRIALNAPEQIACAIAPFMGFLAKVTNPLVYVLGLSTDTFLKLFGIRSSDEPHITEEEIKVLIRQGAESGIFEEAEQDMVERVFRLSDRPIQAMMTPRTEVIWLDVQAPLENNLKKVMESNYSRFPVGEGSLDECFGFVRGKHILRSQLAGEETELQALVQQPLFVPAMTRALNVIRHFKETGIHIAMVTDEYGGIEGIVTLNDLMEAIVGDLPSVERQEEPLIIQRDDGSWLLDGSLDIDEMKSLLNKDHLPDESDFYTVAGFMIHNLRHIPRSGEFFDWENIRFEVMDMDGARVDKVLVKMMPTEMEVSKDKD